MLSSLLGCRLVTGQGRGGSVLICGTEGMLRQEGNTCAPDTSRFPGAPSPYWLLSCPVTRVPPFSRWRERRFAHGSGFLCVYIHMHVLLLSMPQELSVCWIWSSCLEPWSGGERWSGHPPQCSTRSAPLQAFGIREEGLLAGSSRRL